MADTSEQVMRMADEPRRRQPSDFMRARRPELFSDTVVTNEPVIDRYQLEFHLDTLTQRKDEIRFEHFCRRLAEKELCPNLLPQTGPTGGGDSKVDSETYPVAESIASRWYEGDAQAASERWAFAFSAKKRWRDKVKSDVQKIAETRRGYALIYFMTNQAVSDRNRAAVEDELSAAWGISVRLLDRSWILEKVLANRHWDVVFQTLDIRDPRIEQTQVPGPRDAERTRALEELDTLIQDANRYHGNEYQLVEDCLETARLARGLGRPRTEVDGRFDRAERIARTRQDDRQRFRVLYHRAWTALMWYDDREEFVRLYEAAAPLVISDGTVWDLEKLTTLLNAGRAWATEEADWQTPETVLRERLTQLATDTASRTSALWARTQLIFLDLGRHERERLPAAFDHLDAVLREAEGLLDFPVEPIIAIVQLLGEAAPDEAAYGELLENAISLQTRRVSNAEAGRIRLRSGLQLLDATKPYAATIQLARAQSLLAQDEQKELFLAAVAGTAIAYRATGLLWAARANLVIALDRSLYELHRTGTVVPQSLRLLRELLWVELQTGRVPCLFPWIRLLSPLASACTLGEKERNDFTAEYEHLDRVLGILILKTRFADWASLGQVPALLEVAGLLASSGAALYALGHEERFASKYGTPDGGMQRFFSLWVDQPAATDLPDEPEWLLSGTVTMRTAILGCAVTLNSDNNTPSLLLGEALLAAAESFLATTMRLGRRLSPRPHLDLVVRPVPRTDAPFGVSVDEDEAGESRIVITHPEQSAAILARHATYTDAVMAFLVQLIHQLQIPFSAAEKEALFSQERAQDRAVLAAQSPLAVTNLVGEDLDYRRALADSELESLAVIRTTAWQPDPVSDDEGREPLWADGPPPEGVFDLERVKHSDVQTASPINLPLWDRARWRGLGFMHFPDDPVPILVLIFEDPDAGAMIFRGWHKQLKSADSTSLLAITLITGIDRDHPTHYRLAIGAHPDSLLRSLRRRGLVQTAFRMQDMTPDTSVNLDRFLAAFTKTGRYRLVPGGFSQPLHPDARHIALEMTALSATPAWTIGPGDPLRGAVLGIDDPLIPDGVTDPPIFRERADSEQDE